MSLNEPWVPCLTMRACIPQRCSWLNHCLSFGLYMVLWGKGVFVYLVLAISVYILEILEGLYCVYVLSALLGNAFWTCLDQVLHESHSLVQTQITTSDHEHRRSVCRGSKSDSPYTINKLVLISLPPPTAIHTHVHTSIQGHKPCTRVSSSCRGHWGVSTPCS